MFEKCETEIEEELERFDKYEAVVVKVEGGVVKKRTAWLKKFDGLISGGNGFR